MNIISEHLTTMTVAIGWSVSSLLMSLANKMAVTATDAPLALTAAQMCFTTLAACAACDFHFGDGTLAWAFTVPPLFVFMLCASMLSMEFVSLGAWVVIRNLGPIVTLVVESTFLTQTDVRISYQTVCLHMRENDCTPYRSVFW